MVLQIGVLALLRPLLLDSVPTVQHTAALALGRLANTNEELARSVVQSDILPQLVFSLADKNRHYKKAASFVLRTVAKHDPELAMVSIIVIPSVPYTKVLCRIGRRGFRSS